MSGNAIQDPNLSFNELYDQAREAMPMLEQRGNDMLNELRQRHPGVFDSAYFEMGPLKEMDRAQAKVASDYGGKHENIADLARGRLVVDTPEQVEAVRAYMAEKGNELGLEVYKDRFAKPSDTHFRDINTQTRLPNGHLAEMRVEQRDLMGAAKATHEPYAEVQRMEREAKNENRPLTPEEAARRTEIMDQVRDIHDGASNKAGLDPLLNAEGRERLTTNHNERIARQAAEAAARPSAALSLTQEFGRRAGVVGGLVVGGALAASGASASEIALGTAEAAVPGVSSAVAMSEGRTTEAAMRGVEEIPVVGLVATEIARPVARGLGYDVDQSLGQMLFSGGANVDLEQQDFQRRFDGLPMQTTPDMPPEVASLVEHKRMVIYGENLLPHSDPADRQQALARIDAAQNAYTEQYDEMLRNGGIETVDQWITQQNETPKQSAPVQMAEATQTQLPTPRALNAVTP